MRFRFALILALIGFTAACGSSSTSPSGDGGNGGSGGNGTPVSIVKGADTLTTTAYAPNPINVAIGGTVTWKNNDSTTHTSTANNGAWNSGNIAPGASFSMTFPTAGTFQYHCTIHPNMVGTVTVQ